MSIQTVGQEITFLFISGKKPTSQTRVIQAALPQTTTYGGHQQFYRGSTELRSKKMQMLNESS